MTRRASPALVLVLALLGFLLVTTLSSAEADRQEAAPRKARLVELIQQRRSQVDDLDRAVTELRTELATAESRASRASREEGDRAGLSATLALQAGTVAVEGRGLRVQLSDSQREPTSPEDASTHRIHDQDVQLVVNALFASGAEAVAVNDNRIVATTAVRAAGDTIVVNFRPLHPPYVVEAVGADPERFGRSEISRRFGSWTKLFGLGFHVSRVGRLTIPAYTGRVGISVAAPSG